MTKQKQMTEKELEKVAGGVLRVVNADSMLPPPEDRRGIIDPGYTVNPYRIIDPGYTVDPRRIVDPIF